MRIYKCYRKVDKGLGALSGMHRRFVTVPSGNTCLGHATAASAPLSLFVIARRSSGYPYPLRLEIA